MSGSLPRDAVQWFRFLLYSLFYTAMMAPLVGWLFMLLVGVLHAELWPELPTVGYWPSVVIVLLAQLVIGIVFGTPRHTGGARGER